MVGFESLNNYLGKPNRIDDASNVPFKLLPKYQSVIVLIGSGKGGVSRYDGCKPFQNGSAIF